MKFIKDIIGEQRDRMQQPAQALSTTDGATHIACHDAAHVAPLTPTDPLSRTVLTAQALTAADPQSDPHPGPQTEPNSTAELLADVRGDVQVGRQTETADPFLRLDPSNRILSDTDAAPAAVSSNLELGELLQEQVPPVPEPGHEDVATTAVSTPMDPPSIDLPIDLSVLDLPPEQERENDGPLRPAETRAEQPPKPTAAAVGVPEPAPGRGTRTSAAQRAAGRAARVKTRLLGFAPAQPDISDPFAPPPSSTADPRSGTKPPSDQDPAEEPLLFPVGWLTITAGLGRGRSFPLQAGVTTLGRGEDQGLRLDFGDTSISRSTHAALAYDTETRSFFLGHGGKTNLVRLNARPVLSTEALSSGDEIRIGETTLRFTALCGGDFDWAADPFSDNPLRGPAHAASI